MIVANLLLTNWDWKTSNNKIYQLDKPVNGVTRWFMVRDLGASLGKFTYPTFLKFFRLRGFGQGTRNDLPGFEQQGFIERVDDGEVRLRLSRHLPRRDFDGDAGAGPLGVRAAVEAVGPAMERRVSQRAATRPSKRAATRIRSRRRSRRACS